MRRVSSVECPSGLLEHGSTSLISTFSCRSWHIRLISSTFRSQATMPNEAASEVLFDVEIQRPQMASMDSIVKIDYAQHDLLREDSRKERHYIQLCKASTRCFVPWDKTVP